MNTPDFAPQKQHVLTIGLEDYFHVGAFRRLIQPGKWYRFETRLERSTLRTLELLGQFNIKATFFVLGWIADTLPEVVKAVASRGHEVASRGYYHRGVRELTPSEFREDLHRSQAALERASGTKILGYRVGRQWFTPSDFWVLEVLADEGCACGHRGARPGTGRRNRHLADHRYGRPYPDSVPGRHTRVCRRRP